MLPYIHVEPCKKCEGSSAMINEYGMVVMCDMCGSSIKSFQNKYGIDVKEAPSFYVDEESGVVAKVDRRKDYIVIGGGEVLERDIKFII